LEDNNSSLLEKKKETAFKFETTSTTQEYLNYPAQIFEKKSSTNQFITAKRNRKWWEINRFRFVSNKNA
jgi:hypothetical protein